VKDCFGVLPWKLLLSTNSKFYLFFFNLNALDISPKEGRRQERDIRNPSSSSARQLRQP
jgi:hypothetical protein